MSRCWKRRSPQGSWSPRLDRTGGQGELTWEGVWQFSLLPVSTRFSARKLGKYLDQQQVSRYLPGRKLTPQGLSALRGPRAPEHSDRARCCVGYEDSTIETAPIHWLQGWFDVRTLPAETGVGCGQCPQALSRSTATRLVYSLAPCLPLETGCPYEGGLPI